MVIVFEPYLAKIIGDFQDQGAILDLRRFDGGKPKLEDIIIEVRSLWWGRVNLKVYVDELTLAVSGSRSEVVCVVGRAFAYFVNTLENILEMEVSASKSAVVAGRLITNYA